MPIQIHGKETVFNQLNLRNEGHVMTEGPPVNLWCDHEKEGGVDAEKVSTM